MTSRITIEVDFDNGNPYIKVVNDIQSDDVRDKAISHFRQKLGGASNWCTVRFNDIPSHHNQQFFFEIHPVTPHELEKEIKRMEEQNKLNTTNPFPTQS